MGSVNSKSNDSIEDKLLPISNILVNIGEDNDLLEYDKNISYFLIGDKPYGRFRKDTEEIPEGVDVSEYNKVLADAYLCGII